MRYKWDSNLTFWQSFKNVYLVDILESFSIAMAISVIIYYVFLIPNMVEGQSMEPNFHDRELLFTDRTIQWLGSTDLGESLKYNYHRGDVIIFSTHGQDLIKRIIGLPGDKVKISDGFVYVNGELLNEPYLRADQQTYMPFKYESTFKEDEEVTVPDDHYFVMGDNRNNSKDGRFKDVGFIAREDIKGRVLLRYFPFNEFTFYSQQ